MRAMLARLRLDGMVQAAIGVGASALLLSGAANPDTSAAEVRGVLWGLLGLVLAAMASTLEAIAAPEEEPLGEEERWYEYDGTFRRMVG